MPKEAERARRTRPREPDGTPEGIEARVSPPITWQILGKGRKKRSLRTLIKLAGETTATRRESTLRLPEWRRN